MEDLVISGEYKLIKLLITGKHSSVYQCISIKTGKEFAAKIQNNSSSALLR